jgi:SAM-dependent methyltransferase
MSACSPEVKRLKSGVAPGNVSSRLRWPIRAAAFLATTWTRRRARRKAAQAGVAGRVTFERIAAEQLSLVDRFDLVMAFNCIHDMAHPRRVLAAIRQIVKPDGAALWSEAHAGDRLEENLTPQGRTMYASSTMHCMTVSLAQGGEGLGSVIGADQARVMALEASFTRFAKLPVKNPVHQIFLLRR